MIRLSSFGSSLFLIGFLLPSICAQTSGKLIYLRGETRSATGITAQLGSDGTVVSASLLPCSNCHGLDGRGKVEGGLSAPNIRSVELTKPYPVMSGGRRRPAYDESSLRRAIAMGIDSGGNPLSSAMPRYRMSHADMNELLSYLKTVGSPDPGFSGDAVRIGVFLPPAGPLAEARRLLLLNFFAEANKKGIYGRRVELVFSNAPPQPGAIASAIRGFIERNNLFALLSSYVAGAEKEVSAIIGTAAIPVVGAVSLYPYLDKPPNPNLFYLYSGVPGQAEALVATINPKTDSKISASILYTGENSKAVAEFIAAQRGWKTVETGNMPDIKFLSDGIQKSGHQAILLLCPPRITEPLLSEVARRPGLKTTFLIPGSLASPALLEVPFDLSNPVVFAFPERNPGSSGESEAFAEARILLEGLVRAGRDLSRDRLILALEGLYNFDSGSAPVSFAPNRRIGVTGIQLVSIDPQSGKLQPLPK